MFGLIRESELQEAVDLAESLRRRLARAKNDLREAEHRAIAAEGAADVLRHQLDRSETERTDINLKLIRLTLGINPFVDELAPNALPPDPATQTVQPTLSPAATYEDTQTAFVREAVERYGRNNVPAISRHVERRMEEHYMHRDAPPIVTAAEMASAAQVEHDLMAAIAEGAAAAGNE